MRIPETERVLAQIQSRSMLSGDRQGSAGDWILVGVTVAAAIPFIFANVPILVYRHHRCFRKHGGVDLILGSSVSGLIWIASSFVENEHFRRDRGILRACALWAFWLHSLCGFFLWQVCLIMRLQRLLSLACGKEAGHQAMSSLRTWTVYIPLYMAPALAFSVLATLKHIQVFQDSRNYGGSCQYIDTSWKLAGFLTLPLFYIFVLLFSVYKLRGKVGHILFSEYRHSCEAVGMTMMIYLLSTMLYWTNEQYHTSGRCFLTLCVCSIVFFDFWLHMGQPVCLCLFRPKFEMNDLEGRSENIVFPLTSIHTRGVPSHGMPSSEGALLEAVSATIAEAESYKIMKEELEKEKLELIGRINELRTQLGFSTISKNQSLCLINQ